MMIRFSCSSCGKDYEVKEEVAGRRAKCSCGSEILIPAKSDSGPGGRPCEDDPDVKNFDRDRIIRRNFLARLIGCSIGAVIGVVIVFVQAGMLAAVLAGAGLAAVVFCMTKIGRDYDLKVTKDKETYRAYKAKFKIDRSTAGGKVKLALFIFGLLAVTVLSIYRAVDAEGFNRFFSAHMGLKLIFLAVNNAAAIAIVIYKIGWEKYWKIFKWGLVPFNWAFKRYWKLLIEDYPGELMILVSIEALFIILWVLECVIIDIFLG